MVPRKKVRIRVYNQFSIEGPCRLEIKKTHSHHREKEIFKIDNFELNQIQRKIKKIDNKFLLPILYVEYEREYFSFENVRLTLDTNIKYKKYNSNFYTKDYRNVLELKYNGGLDNYVSEKIIGEKVRFSKYGEAIENLNLI